MIEDYKKFLKENREFLFQLTTISSFMLIFLFVSLGGISSLVTFDRFVRNTSEMRVYQENLATFQKCAEKITDASLVETYCGSAPNEPVLTW